MICFKRWISYKTMGFKSGRFILFASCGFYELIHRDKKTRSNNNIIEWEEPLYIVYSSDFILFYILGFYFILFLRHNYIVLCRNLRAVLISFLYRERERGNAKDRTDLLARGRKIHRLFFRKGMIDQRNHCKIKKDGYS